MSEMQKRLDLIKARTLNPILFYYWRKSAWFFDFLQAIGENGYEDISGNHVYFLPVYPPAIQFNLKIELTNGAKIVAMDMQSLNSLTKRESIAVLLHELGHVINPSKDPFENEFNADEYALSRGYGVEIISSIPKLPPLPGDANSDVINKRRVETIEAKLQDSIRSQTEE
jgi:hypothetical protein